MKKRIVNLGLPGTHRLITTLSDFNQDVALTEFDAFILDPNALIRGLSPANHPRRSKEISDLIKRKGGIIICLIRPDNAIILGNNVSPGSIYSLFASLSASTQIQGFLQTGSGATVRVIPTAKGVSGGYFRTLQGSLVFTAYLTKTIDDLDVIGGRVFAVDSVSNPIAVEFAIGAGRICFVPMPNGADGDRVGSAIVRVVEAHYGGPTEIDSPAWASEISVPGANMNDATILELEKNVKHIEEEISQLKRKRAEILRYRILLYGYGKSALEPVVRAGLRELGFVVPEPEKYSGEWDVELNSEGLATFAIGEIEGSEGVIDVDKYRQLLDYVQTEALEGRDHKGILLGNGYRLASPESPEREAQFSQHALRGASKNQFCLLPTTELFKAVSAVLETPADEGLRIRIRHSILTTVGVWIFARPMAVIREEVVPAS